jgi:hypothetical protein
MAKVNEELQALEIFEIEVLELLNSKKFLDQFYFGGGTMLRLCHNLNRYSTDLDFWSRKETDSTIIFNSLAEILTNKYQIVDSQNKHFTIVLQIKSSLSKRSLKIEIRKDQQNFEWERKIAFSKFTTRQVQVCGLTLQQMMKNKTSALISRKLIRDCFDINFLLRRGVTLLEEKDTVIKMVNIIKRFKDRDYKVTLGSLLDAEERELFYQTKFSFLMEELASLLNK